MGHKLEQLYTDILDYTGLGVTEEGVVYDTLTDDNATLLIEGRKVVLPTQQHLRSQEQDKIQIFHPLLEHINRGESAIVHKLRHRLNVTLNFATLNLVKGLLTLLNSPALHKKLNPEQRQLLTTVTHTDVTLTAKFAGFGSKLFADGVTKAFLSLFLKKAGTYRGQKHARIGVVTFTFKEAVEESKFKPQEKEALQALFDFVFPGNGDDPEAYNAFSDSRDAPWLEALLKSSYCVASRINELITLYREFLDEEENHLFNTSWIDAIDNIEPYMAEIRLIPTQKGNEGSVEMPPTRIVPAATVASAPATSRAMPAAPAQQQEQATTSAPFVQHPAGHVPQPTGYSHHPQQPQYPQHPPYPQYPVPAQLPPGYPQPYPPGYPPGYPQHPQQVAALPPQAPGLRTTGSGKLSFESIEATNPAVAAAAYVQTGVTEWAARQQQQQHPGMMGHDPRLAPISYDPRMMPGGYPPAYDPRMAPAGYPPPYDPRAPAGYAPAYGAPAPAQAPLPYRGVRPI